MSYHCAGELRKFEDYVMIGWKVNGGVEFREGTPPEIQDEFWKMWPEYRKKVVERQNSGTYSSDYPLLPDVDPNENRIHYGAPLIMKVNKFTGLFKGLKTSDEVYEKYDKVDQSRLSELEIDELKVACFEASMPLYQDEADRNVFLSPYSIVTLFLLLSDASAGTTSLEIQRALYVELAHHGFPEQMKSVREKLFWKRGTLDQLLRDPILSGIYTDRSANLHTAMILLAGWKYLI